VLAITAEAEIGKIYVGKVERIVDFGAFVNILPGKDGLVHISMLSDQRVEKVTDVLKEGQEVEVLVLDVDNRGRIKLSIKDVAAAAKHEYCKLSVRLLFQYPIENKGIFSFV